MIPLCHPQDILSVIKACTSSSLVAWYWFLNAIRKYQEFMMDCFVRPEPFQNMTIWNSYYPTLRMTLILTKGNSEHIEYPGNQGYHFCNVHGKQIQKDDVLCGRFQILNPRFPQIMILCLSLSYPASWFHEEVNVWSSQYVCLINSWEHAHTCLLWRITLNCSK